VKTDVIDSGKRILVVGDYMVDEYRFLSPKGLSPEAPIVCFKEEKQERRHGGAGNVAMNLMALGAKPFLLSSFDAKDAPEMPFDNLVVDEYGRKTTIKERLLTTRQQIARIDKQSDTRIGRHTVAKMLDERAVARFMADVAAIVFSDYDHGVMVEELVLPIMGLAKAKGIPTVVDSKAKDSLRKYRGCTLMVPNREEARVIGGFFGNSVSTMANWLRVAVNSDAVAVTCGPEGVYLEYDGGNRHFPAAVGDDRVVDVTGAGDTFTALCSLGLAVGLPLDSIMEVSNAAAGIKIGKLGVASVSALELREVLNGQDTGIRT
jgi:D-beta-D-heptose 7-phosphate kinase/D-beta-D-heptose 1-phosphate adenosyltransferase